jgi:hypothetical protein
LFPETKIFVAGNSGGFQIVANNENGNFATSWNYHWPGNAAFEIRTMAAFLPHKLKTSGEKHSLQSFPVNWRGFGHGRSSRNRRGMFFNANPVGTLPARAVVYGTGALQNFGQCALLFRRLDEKFHGFVRLLRPAASRGR